MAPPKSKKKLTKKSSRKVCVDCSDSDSDTDTSCSCSSCSESDYCGDRNGGGKVRGKSKGGKSKLMRKKISKSKGGGKNGGTSKSKKKSQRREELSSSSSCDCSDCWSGSTSSSSDTSIYSCPFDTGCPLKPRRK